MTEPNIVLFCENNHLDFLTHAAEEAVIDRLDKKKWTHSLVEGHDFLFSPTDLEDIDLIKSYMLKQSPKDLCFRNSKPRHHKFNNSFISYDFDVDDSNRNGLFSEMDMCSKLDKIDQSLVDSEFFGLLAETFYKDQPVDTQRDIDIVQNLEILSAQLGKNHTIGWAGQAHCIYFHHHLTETNSSLLKNLITKHFKLS